MKVLCKKVIIFIIILCGVIWGLGWLSKYELVCKLLVAITNSADYMENSGADEIKPFIDRVQQKDGTTKLIIGDSMCQQMFNGLQQYNTDYTIAGSNGAITMAGQYLLVNEYLKNHENVTDIYIYLHPSSLGRGIDSSVAYSYIVMPFGLKNALSALDTNTLDDMKSVYGAIFLKPVMMKWLENFPVGRKVYFNVIKDSGKVFEEESMYDIPNQYIEKIYSMCKEKNITLHLYPSPVSEHFYEDIEKRKLLYSGTWLEEHFPEFFSKIVYFPREQAADGTHFSEEYATQEHFNEWIRIIFRESELLDTLKFE